MRMTSNIKCTPDDDRVAEKKPNIRPTITIRPFAFELRSQFRLSNLPPTVAD